MKFKKLALKLSARIQQKQHQKKEGWQEESEGGRERETKSNTATANANDNHDNTQYIWIELYHQSSNKQQTTLVVAINSTPRIHR